MIKSIKDLKNCSSECIIICAYFLLIVFIPKNISTIFNVIPIRLFLSFTFILVMFFKIKKKLFINTIVKNRVLLIVYCLFAISTIPSLLVSKSLVISCYTLLKFIIIPLLIIICLTVKPNDNDKKLLFTVLTIGTILLVILSYLQYIFGIELFKEGIEKYPGAKGRVSITFFNTIYYGIFLNLISPIYILKYIKSKEKEISTCFFVILIIIYISLLLTFTRSAFLIFWSLTFILILFLINKRNIIKICAMLLSMLALTFIIPGAKYMAYTSINNGFQMIFKVDLIKDKKNNDNNNNSSNFDAKHENNSSNIENNSNDNKNDNRNDNKYGGDLSLIHREQFGDIAKRIGKDHPFTGVGFGAYMNYMDSDDFSTLYSSYNGSKTHPHSAIILLYAECGIISVIFFFMFLFIIPISLFIKLFKTLKFKDSNNYIIYLCTFAISIGFIVVNIISENAIYDAQIFPLFVIILFITYNFKKEENHHK